VDDENIKALREIRTRVKRKGEGWVTHQQGIGAKAPEGDMVMKTKQYIKLLKHID
jgi:hypothetical protein